MDSAVQGPGQKENWSSEAYQNVASFVPKLATVVLQWLDVQKDDLILDIGCGDGVLNLQIAQILATGKGKIHGIDSSAAMIASAKRAAAADAKASEVCTFEVLNATDVLEKGRSFRSKYDKVFSNAAMHWILRPEATRETFFHGVRQCLKEDGLFVFEMGGMGNVPEVRATFLAVISRRIGILKAREIDPWFFPDETWMRDVLEVKLGGWRVEKIELAHRPTPTDEGGIEGWVRLMGKQFFDAVEEGGRENCIREACDVLETVCRSPGGGDWLSYVRLRAVVRKI